MCQTRQVPEEIRGFIGHEIPLLSDSLRTSWVGSCQTIRTQICSLRGKGFKRVEWKHACTPFMNQRPGACLNSYELPTVLWGLNVSFCVCLSITFEWVCLNRYWGDYWDNLTYRWCCPSTHSKAGRFSFLKRFYSPLRLHVTNEAQHTCVDWLINSEPSELICCV